MQRRLRIIMDETKSIQPDCKTNYVMTSHYITSGRSKVEDAVEGAILGKRDTLVLYPKTE